MGSPASFSPQSPPAVFPSPLEGVAATVTKVSCVEWLVWLGLELASLAFLGKLCLPRGFSCCSGVSLLAFPRTPW